MRAIRILIYAAWVFSAMPSVVAQTATSLSEAEIEMRAKEIGRSLRCVVCQNQSIEDSDASLAEDMRRLVRSRVANGESEEEVIAFMQNRYGDFVLLKPPVQTNTYVLWFTPFVLALGGLIWFVLQKRRRPNLSLTDTLTDAEFAELENVSHK